MLILILSGWWWGNWGWRRWNRLWHLKLPSKILIPPTCWGISSAFSVSKWWHCHHQPPTSQNPPEGQWWWHTDAEEFPCTIPCPYTLPDLPTLNIIHWRGGWHSRCSKLPQQVFDSSGCHLYSLRCVSCLYWYKRLCFPLPTTCHLPVVNINEWLLLLSLMLSLW